MSRAPSRSNGLVVAGLMLAVLLSGCGGDSSGAAPPPVTQSFDATTTIGETVMLDVLSHVTDPGGGSLSVVSATSAGGTATVAANGEIAFTPAAGFSGSTTVSYVVANMAGGQASGQVSVTVTPAPHKVLVESGPGQLGLVSNGQIMGIEVPGPLAQVTLSPTRRYVAYSWADAPGESLAVYDLSLGAAVLGVSQGSTALFTADESQVWIRQASTPLTQPQSVQLQVASLPSGALTTVEEFGNNCGPVNLAFAAGDTKLFYGVVCNNRDTAASGIFSIDRAGPWNPQRITAAQTSASLSDTGLFAVDAAGERLIYQLVDSSAGISVWSVTVGNPNAALVLAANSCLAPSGPATALSGGGTTRAISPDGGLAFIAAPGGLCDQPGQPGTINVTTSLVSTQAAGTVYQSGLFAYNVFRSDSKQAIIAQPVSDYVVQLSAVNLSAPGDPPTLIDTESAISSPMYTDDGHWLVYIHQDPNDSSSPPRSARLYAWNTAGGSAPVRLAPDINDFVTFFAVAADSRTVAFSTANVSGTDLLYLVDISAPAYALQITPPGGCCGAIYGVY
jgi:hypothetical protein